MSEKMPLATEDPNRERNERLRRDFPEAFTEGKIDFEKLRAALGEDVSGERERYGLSWAGKSGAIRNIQTPSVATLVPQRGESVAFDETENLFIEGDNLEVLKLLQKSYHGRVKMIYIDPPYNTGNEFIYPDNFREGIDDYLRYSGQTDEEGMKLATNTETGGRYHSKWLNMMYPRLFLARNLLREDGVIFISIDDHEVSNLRLLINEVFGEENFLASFTRKRRASSAMADKLVSVDHEYIVAYHRPGFSKLLGIQKDYSSYKNPDNDPRGPWTPGDLTVGMGKDLRPNQYYDLVDPKTDRSYPANPNRVWAFIPNSMQELIREGRVLFPESEDKRPMLKRYRNDLKSEVNPVSTWIRGVGEETSEEVEILESGLNSEGTRRIQELFGANVFNYSKPVSLLASLVGYCTEESDIILDFFAGSATTAHAVMEMNREDGGERRFIMVQLPEKTDNPDYPTIADIGRERVRRVITNLHSQDEGRLPDESAPEQDRGFRAFRLTSSNFAIWDGEAARDAEGEVLDQQVLEFADNVNPDRSPEDILYEILLKSGLPLTAKVEEVPVAGRSVYSVAGGLLIVCLAAQIDEDLVRGVMAMEPKPERFVCLDAAFGDNDALKTNTKLQARDSGVGFRTI